MILFGANDIDGKSIYIMDEKFDLSLTLLESTSHWHLIYSPKMFLVHKINRWTTRIRLFSILNESVCVCVCLLMLRWEISLISHHEIEFMLKRLWRYYQRKIVDSKNVTRLVALKI